MLYTKNLSKSDFSKYINFLAKYHMNIFVIDSTFFRTSYIYNYLNKK